MFFNLRLGNQTESHFEAIAGRSHRKKLWRGGGNSVAGSLEPTPAVGHPRESIAHQIERLRIECRFAVKRRVDLVRLDPVQSRPTQERGISTSGLATRTKPLGGGRFACVDSILEPPGRKERRICAQTRVRQTWSNLNRHREYRPVMFLNVFSYLEWTPPRKWDSTMEIPG